MSDDISDIAAYYAANVSMEARRLEEHQLEFDLTWRLLEQVLPAAGRILEIGAATGRYTLPLAQRGCHVTAVDLAPELLAECGRTLERAGLAERVRLVVADARDLAPVPVGVYDAVLLMGPLYHLIVAEDRRSAAQAALARLRPGGIFVSAWTSRFGVLGDLLVKRPEWIADQDEAESMLRAGQRPVGRPRGGFRGYHARPDEIVPFHAALGLETLRLAGVEPLVGADEAAYNRLGEPLRSQWLALLYTICVEPSIVGASRHILYIGRKPAAEAPLTPAR